MRARDETRSVNEALLREVNERIEEISEDAEQGWMPQDGMIEFHCECGRACGGRVRMTLEEYGTVREQDDRFVVVPGHSTPEIERVVDESERYAIVDKLAEAEPLVGADGVPRSDDASRRA
jgi:diaminopimelate decarboxylase